MKTFLTDSMFGTMVHVASTKRVICLASRRRDALRIQRALADEELIKIRKDSTVKDAKDG